MSAASELERILIAFISEVVALSKREALSRVEEALGLAATSLVNTADRRPTLVDDEELSATPATTVKQRIVDHLRLNPGSRGEHLNVALGAARRQLAGPIRQLLTEGIVRAEGLTRGKRYYLAGDEPH